MKISRISPQEFKKKYPDYVELEENEENIDYSIINIEHKKDVGIIKYKDTGEFDVANPEILEQYANKPEMEMEFLSLISGGFTRDLRKEKFFTDFDLTEVSTDEKVLESEEQLLLLRKREKYTKMINILVLFIVILLMGAVYIYFS